MDEEYWVTVKISKKLAVKLDALRGNKSLDVYVENIMRVHAKAEKRFIMKTIKEIRGER